MSETTNIKDSVKSFVDALKQLPREKQEYVNGYVQGVADANKDSAQNQNKPA